jgi:drug/metabolite transporter (DMT)-like permease
VFYVLALASAALYGSADFLGGLASRRAHTIAVVVISQCAGLIALALMMPLLPASPSRDDLIWGAAAGVAGGIGVALLYRALAIGVMAVVAPITAVCAVIVPVAAAITFGERPGARTTVGIAVAIVAIVLVSQQQVQASTDGASTSARRGSVAIAFLSGVAIGLFFLALARTRAEAGMWPLVAARSMSFGLFATIALVMRLSIRMPKGVGTLTVAGGVLDMLANLLYLVASRYGPLSVVVTLSSLYPASTVLLARTVLRERLSATQVLGIVCALIAVVLIVG